MSTASTEKMLDSSATDTNIAVIVASRPPPRRPPQHRGGPRRPHTCTHNTHTTTRSYTTSTVSSSSSFPLSCQLSTVNLLALSRRPALFSEALRERAVVDTSASTTRDDDGDGDDDDDDDDGNDDTCLDLCNWRGRQVAAGQEATRRLLWHSRRDRSKGRDV